MSEKRGNPRSASSSPPGKRRAQSRNTAQRMALCGLLTTLMLILGYVESQLPILPGTPGIKLGLSNAVLLYGVYLLPASYTAGLMVVKVLLSAMLFGNPAAMAYSFAGGALSVAGMLLMHRFSGFGVVAVSVVGAILHNVGQVLVFYLVLQNVNIFYYLVMLTLVGIGTGVLTGIVAGLVMKAGVGMALNLNGKKGGLSKASVPNGQGRKAKALGQGRDHFQRPLIFSIHGREQRVYIIRLIGAQRIHHGGGRLKQRR